MNEKQKQVPEKVIMENGSEGLWLDGNADRLLDTVFS